MISWTGMATVVVGVGVVAIGGTAEGDVSDGTVAVTVVVVVVVVAATAAPAPGGEAMATWLIGNIFDWEVGEDVGMVGWGNDERVVEPTEGGSFVVSVGGMWE